MQLSARRVLEATKSDGNGEFDAYEKNEKEMRKMGSKRLWESGVVTDKRLTPKQRAKVREALARTAGKPAIKREQMEGGDNHGKCRY
jgi:hypothetical protein